MVDDKQREGNNRDDCDVSIYKISGGGSRRVAPMVFESHFCPSESGTRFPDWLPGGFDGNKISARCADVSATDANYSFEFTHRVNETFIFPVQHFGARTHTGC
jgi:hypothetical protein